MIVFGVQIYICIYIYSKNIFFCSAYILLVYVFCNVSLYLIKLAMYYRGKLLQRDLSKTTIDLIYSLSRYCSTNIVSSHISDVLQYRFQIIQAETVYDDIISLTKRTLWFAIKNHSRKIFSSTLNYLLTTSITIHFQHITMSSLSY